MTSQLAWTKTGIPKTRATFTAAWLPAFRMRLTGGRHPEQSTHDQAEQGHQRDEREHYRQHPTPEAGNEARSPGGANGTGRRHAAGKGEAMAAFLAVAGIRLQLGAAPRTALHGGPYILRYRGPLPPSRGVQRGPSTSVALQSMQLGGFTRSSSPTRSYTPAGHT